MKAALLLTRTPARALERQKGEPPPARIQTRILPKLKGQLLLTKTPARALERQKVEPPPARIQTRILPKLKAALLLTKTPARALERLKVEREKEPVAEPMAPTLIQAIMQILNLKMHDLKQTAKAAKKKPLKQLTAEPAADQTRQSLVLTLILSLAQILLLSLAQVMSKPKKTKSRLNLWALSQRPVKATPSSLTTSKAAATLVLVAARMVPSLLSRAMA
jgi:hypothetical protein